MRSSFQSRAVMNNVKPFMITFLPFVSVGVQLLLTVSYLSNCTTVYTIPYLSKHWIPAMRCCPLLMWYGYPKPNSTEQNMQWKWFSFHFFFANVSIISLLKGEIHPRVSPPVSMWGESSAPYQLLKYDSVLVSHYSRKVVLEVFLSLQKTKFCGKH